MKKYLICECELEAIVMNLNRNVLFKEDKTLDRSILLNAIDDYVIGGAI